MFDNDGYNKNESLTRNIQRAFMGEVDETPDRFEELLDQLRAVEMADRTNGDHSRPSQG